MMLHATVMENSFTKVDLTRFYSLVVGFLCVFLFKLFVAVGANVIEISENNVKQVLLEPEVALLNFYADWCYYSRQLEPIFLEASEKFPPPNNETNYGKQKVVFGKVDCVKNENLCAKHRISKYPTIKLFQKSVARKEYRGSRTTDAIANFIIEQLKSPFKQFSSEQELMNSLNKDSSNIVGYFVEKSGVEWEIFEWTAGALRYEECHFSFVLGTSSAREIPRLLFIDSSTSKAEIFSGDLRNKQYVVGWIRDKCVPLIRELTFENAEGLTEVGLPFLVLFKHKDDKASLETFSQAVVRELIDQKEKVMTLHADGEKFSHPLYHLGKTVKDLPVVAIDSFQHMYLFPHFDDLKVNGKLLKFIKDLHSERLHKRFHNMPVEEEREDEEVTDKKSTEEENDAQEETTTKTSSVFKKLKPSPYRYTLLGNKDEL